MKTERNTKKNIIFFYFRGAFEVEALNVSTFDTGLKDRCLLNVSDNF